MLVLASPLMRGGNRHVALMVLESISLLILLALFARRDGPDAREALRREPLMFLLAASPALMGIVQLTPLPGDVWADLPGRAVFAEALRANGLAVAPWRPLSLSPDATAASLLAGLPLSAALLLGFLASSRQLDLLLKGVVAMAVGQVIFGLLQMPGGAASPLMFGAASGAPVGTFGNRNHFASYLTMALCAYLCLWVRARTGALLLRGEPNERWRHLVWAAGGVLLLLGILMSRSRGAVGLALPAALLAAILAGAYGMSSVRTWRIAVGVTAIAVGTAIALVGAELAGSRFAAGDVSDAARFRLNLAYTSLQGALAFWPLGSGFGTYDLAYPRFQPVEIAGFANHAHMDWVELLFEGGIFVALLALAVLWMVVRRAILLVRLLRQDRGTIGALVSTLCGLGLLGLLMHSLVEFNLRIPANAILGALLAGIYLRPITTEPPDDRPAQPHSSRHR